MIGETIWAVDYGGGNIVKGTRGKKKWHKVASLGSEYFEVIQFVDSLHGFVCGDYGFVYKTSDAGVSWQEISPPVPDRLIERFRNDSTKDQEPAGLFAAYYSMYFTTASSGFVSGFAYNPAKGFRASYQRLLYRTEDAGETWVLLDPDQKEKLIEEIYEEMKPGLLTIDGKYFTSAGARWHLARHREKGHLIIHRKSHTTPADTVVLEATTFERIMLRKIVFLDDKNGFVFGGALDENSQKAVIYETRDSGKSWSYHASDWPHIHDAFFDGANLWLFGKERFIKKISIQ